MLNQLFGSKARVKILKLFLSKPEEKFYIRQISRDLKLQLNSVRRELENLEKFGLLVSNPEDEQGDESITREEFIRVNTPNSKRPNKKKALKKLPTKLEKKYYRANKSFILFEEIKALILKAQILYEKDFVEKVYKTGAPKLVVLTGFFVNLPGMEIDLLLVGRLNKIKLKKLIKDLENEIGREINFTLMGAQEFKYRKDITDIFLYSILDANKLVIIDEFGLN